MPKINREEYEVLKELDDEWKWIARDKDGTLVMGAGKNERYLDGWFPPENIGDSLVADEINAVKVISEWGNLFQFIQWEDEGPYNVAELIEEYLYDNQPKLFIDGQEQSFEFIEESEEEEMKKGIEWLRDRYESMETIKVTTKNSRGKRSTSYLKKKTVINLLNQLDEPEVLSQEKVQIPRFVYKWIEHQKMFDFTIYDLLSLASKGKWATESMNKFINENGELFIKAWLAYPDIEVEEQKYVVPVDENHALCKFADDVWGIYKEYTNKLYLDDDFKFTEQEIKDYDERYWPFAVKVEELEE